jgi:hypothetical protein
MMRLVCTECGAIWYTANISDDKICDTCEGKLEEINEETAN